MIRLAFSVAGWVTCKVIPADVATRAAHTVAAFQSPADRSRRTTPAGGPPPVPPAGPRT